MSSFAFTRLLVKDFRATFLFYRDVMGFKSNFGTEDDVYADFETGETSLALFRRDFMAHVVGKSDAATEADCQDRTALIFQVDSVDTSVQDLKAKGVAFVTEPTDRVEWGIRTAHFRDPDGNLLEIFTRLA